MSSYKNLFEFLQDHKTTKDRNTITHTRIPGVDDKSAPVRGGSYHIPDEELPMFYKLYHQHVFVNKKPEYLTEAQRHDGNIPILVDLDFRYDPKIKFLTKTNFFGEWACPKFRKMSCLPDKKNLAGWFHSKTKVVTTSPEYPQSNQGPNYTP